MLLAKKEGPGGLCDVIMSCGHYLRRLFTYSPAVYPPFFLSRHDCVCKQCISLVPRFLKLLIEIVSECPWPEMLLASKVVVYKEDVGKIHNLFVTSHDLPGF